MTRRPSAPQQRPKRPRGAAPTAPAPDSAEGRAGWLRRLRFTGFSAVMIGVIVLGVLIIAPNLRTYVEQRQQIAALQAQVNEDRRDLSTLHAERQRWNDKTYIMTQARDRLYYVNPGEISYIVVNDLDPAVAGAEPAPVSEKVEARQSDWSRGLLGSFLSAGLAETTAGDPAPR